jgi:transposase-like protein/predicted DNA-binding protein (UPF0251 family)
MTPEKKNASRARIPADQFLEILRLFALDLNASQIAELLGLNRNTVNRYVMAIRKRIARHCKRGRCYNSEHGPLCVTQVTGVRGRNPSQAHVLIWLFEERGSVYTEIVPHRFTAVMQAIMRGKVRPAGVFDVLGLDNCNAIADLDNKRIFHVRGKGRDRCGKKAAIAPADRFWGVVKQRMVKMRGIKRTSLPYHLKECEFRFNNGQHDLAGLLRSIIELDPVL